MQPPVHPNHEARHQISRLIREDWGRILAALVASTRNYTLAEDSLQDAVVSALEVWPEKGLPDKPGAWMVSVARRKAIDRLRRQQTMTRKEDELAHWLEVQRDNAPDEFGTVPDRRLELMFSCCHPALDQKSRVALTLRSLGGLSTAEIAAAFLNKPEAMAARLTRAKKKLTVAGIGFKVPEPEDLEPRIDAVLKVIYLIFNERAHASNGALTRTDLVTEAIRLGRIVASLMPQDSEAKGLLALMLLSDSRRFARTDAKGDFVPLELQNRARWDRSKITEGLGLVEGALSNAPARPYAIQAAISALHAQAATFQDTDWPQIVALYDVLQARSSNPILAVNQAVALSYAQSPEAGLALLEQIAPNPKLERYQPFHTSRADLLARAGRSEEAAQSYHRAIALSPTQAQVRFLNQRLHALESP